MVADIVAFNSSGVSSLSQFSEFLARSHTNTVTHQIYHGPDSIEQFDVIRELQSDAPDVYQLIQTLRNTNRNKSDQETYRKM